MQAASAQARMRYGRTGDDVRPRVVELRLGAEALDTLLVEDALEASV